MQLEGFKLWEKKMIADKTFANTINEPEKEVQQQQPASTENNIEYKSLYDPNKYLGGIYDTRPKSPVYNTSLEKQNQAMMKAQSIGNLLALIGDLGGVAVGANVARREPKPLEPYMQAIQNKKEQFEQEKKIFDQQDFLYRLKEAESKEAQEYQKEKDIREQQKYEADKLEKQLKYLTERGEKQEADKLRLKIAELNIKSREKIAAASRKLKEEGAKQKGPEKPYIQVRVAGKDSEVTEGEFREYLQKTLEAEGKSDKEVESWMSKLLDAKELTKYEYERKVADYIMKRTSDDPIFKEYWLQRNNEDGITDFEEYRKKYYKKTTPEELINKPTDKWSKYARK